MLKFKCPKCGCEHAIERVLCDGINSHIDVIHENGELEYGQCDADGDILNVQYECRDCNFVVPNASSQDEFVEWVKENCK